MGRGLARIDRGGLRPRVFSALAMAPLPVAALCFGGPWLALLTALAGAIMAWEWVRVCRGGLDAMVPTECAVIGIVVAAVALAALGVVFWALATAALGAGAVLWVGRRRPGTQSGWIALGVLWVAIPCVCLLWLARDDAGGRTTVLWILVVVWATDIGAYAIGRSLGGPRLAPTRSPGKTWAGFIGGTVCGGLTGGAAAVVLGRSPALAVGLISAGLAIVGQLGDLAESSIKRRFGVKDSGGLIPGHGGLLDRLDSLLAAVPAVALLTALGGRSLAAWP
jgi:phosphatidate cytidylyltransferase